MNEKTKQTALIIILVCVVTLFLIGVHNIDNAWNGLRLGENFVDCGFSGECFTLSQLYNIGLFLVIFLMIVIIAISIEIGKELV